MIVIKFDLTTSRADKSMLLNAFALEIPCPIITGAFTPKIGVPPKFSQKIPNVLFLYLVNNFTINNYKKF